MRCKANRERTHRRRHRATAEDFLSRERVRLPSAACARKSDYHRQLRLQAKEETGCSLGSSSRIRGPNGCCSENPLLCKDRRLEDRGSELLSVSDLRRSSVMLSRRDP